MANTAAKPSASQTVNGVLSSVTARMAAVTGSEKAVEHALFRADELHARHVEVEGQQVAEKHHEQKMPPTPRSDGV